MSEKQRVILLPVDCSSHSVRAFKWYIDNLFRSGDKLGIVHIHEPPLIPSTMTLVGPMVLPDDWNDKVKASFQTSKQCAEQFEAKAKELGIDNEVYLRTSHHGVGQAICDVADQTNAAGVVMGSRGLNAFRRTLLGSVSEYVASHCRSAVTVTPPAD